MSRIRWYGPSLVLLTALIAVMVLAPRFIRQLAFEHERARITQIRNELATSQALLDVNQAFRDVAEVVRPSVVHINVLSRLPGSRYNRTEATSNGSGWVYDDEGHVITNHHVVVGAQEIEVRFADGSTYRAQLVGSDPQTDIAVLRVPGALIHPAERAPDESRQGDLVFAFGSPFADFDFSMSQGVVSAVDRRLGMLGPNGYERLIQTDAAINPGNSGGPLTNILGQVVGMNTAIAVDPDDTPHSGTFLGVGFAIPVDMVEEIADRLIATGTVRRGFLGIVLDDQELTPELARSFGFDGRGVLVDSVQVNGEPSPAALAGLQSGDIITRINGEAVTTRAELRATVALIAPGEKVEVEYFRQGQIWTTDVTLAAAPTNTTVLPDGPAGSDDALAGEAGAEVRLRRLGLENLVTHSPEFARRLRRPFIEGVFVDRVRRDSVADERLQALPQVMSGDVITHVFDEEVNSLVELWAAVDRHAGEPGLRLKIERWFGGEGLWRPSTVYLRLD